MAFCWMNAFAWTLFPCRSVYLEFCQSSNVVLLSDSAESCVSMLHGS